MPSLLVAKPKKPPRVDHAPEAETFEVAEEAVVIAELAGLHLDDWQEYALWRSMGMTDGRWAAFETGLVVPRQDGKTEILVARCLSALFSETTDSRLSIYTAHEYKTAREVFIRTRQLLDPPRDADPDLVADGRLLDQVKTIRTANGEEAIELHNGRRLRFLARTSGSGRGFTGDLVILDEAYRLNLEQMAALLPTLSARPNPQVYYASMGPMDDSEVQLSIRQRALEGGEDLCYLEWSIPDDASIDDVEGWKSSNPAEPHRITIAHMRKERAALGDEEFARERLCSHTRKHHAVIPADVWFRLADRKSVTVGPVRFAVDIPPERNSASIAVAGSRADERPHIELIEHRPGVEWVQPRLLELLKAHRKSVVVLDPSSAAGSLISGLTAANHKPVLVSGREMAQACGQFYDTAQTGGMAWRPGPHEAVVAAAVDAGRKRPVGDAWAWHRRDTSVDISPLVALTLALYGMQTQARKRRRVIAG